MPYLVYFDIFLIALLAVMILTPLVRKLAFQFNWLDQPEARKVHAQPIPRVGGLAIYGGILIAFLAASYGLNLLQQSHLIQAILWTSMLLVFLGWVDDVKGVSAWTKLLFQLGVASLAYWLGIRIEFIQHPFSAGYWFFSGISYPITVLWMIIFMNIINLIDGLDGLASGLTAVASATLFVSALFTGQQTAAVLAVILLGACLGFLRHNFYPARIFMGDCGSLLLGYWIAVISIVGVLKSTASIAVAVPVLAVAVPMLDTVLAIVRRIKKRQPIFRADREHLHHQLLFRGYSHRQATLIMLYMGSLLSVFGILFSVLEGFLAWACFLALVLILGVGVRMIRKLSV